MRRLLSLLTDPKRRAPLFILVVIFLYLFLSRPIEAVQDLVLREPYAYLAVGLDGVRVVDISDPAQPLEVAHFQTRGFASSVAYIDPYLYVASGRDGLLILRPNDTHQLEEISRMPAQGSIEQVVVAGELAYLLDTRSGVRVLSLREPSNPVQLGTIPFRSRLSALAAGEGRLYVADTNRTMHIFDLGLAGTFTEISSQQLPANIVDLSVEGSFIYVACEDKQIYIYDVYDPSNIVEAARHTLQNTPVSMDRFSTYGFISQGPQGVEVVDFSNPYSPRTIGDYQGIVPVLNVFVAPDRAYLAAELSGMQATAFQVRMEPAQIGESTPPADAQEVEIQGGLAFLAAGGSGLRILNVADPGQPFQTGFFDTPGYASQVLVSGDVALIADQTGGLIAVDISRIEGKLKEVSTLGTSFQVNRLAKDNDLVFLAEGEGGLRIVDYADPFNPLDISRLDTPGNALDIALTSDYVYLADGTSGIRIIQVGNPAQPLERAALDTPGDARAITVAESLTDRGRFVFAYVADGSRGLRIVNVSDPRSPFVVGALEIPGFAQDVLVQDQTAYLAMGDKGVAVVDIANPAAPLLLGYFNTPGDARGLALRDGFVYVADHERGLLVILGEQPDEMIPFGLFDAPRAFAATYAEDSFLYATDGRLGLWTLDASHANQIKLLSQTNLLGQPGRITRTEGGTLVVAAGDAGVHFLDMTEPARPLHTGTQDTPGLAQGLAVRGELVYVADGEAGLHLVDARDALNPVLISSLNTDGSARDVALSGEYAFVADGPAGLLAVRVRELRNPAKVGVFSSLGDARAVEVAGKYAYVAAGAGGLHVIDIEHPLTMAEVAILPMDGQSVDLVISGAYAFVANDQTGLQMVDISQPSQPRLVGSADNPFPGVSVASLSLNPSSNQPKDFRAYVSAGNLGLRVFDVKESMIFTRLGLYETPGSASVDQILGYLQAWISSDPGPVSEKVSRTLRQGLFDIVLMGGVGFFAWLVSFGQFVLPARDRKERLETVNRLVFYMLGAHGPAVRVKEGRIIQSTKEQTRVGPGVALVDLSSAIVLERGSNVYPLLAGTIRNVFQILTGWFVPPERKTETDASKVRVAGPGIIFTGARVFSNSAPWEEKVRGIVDLRPQVRIEPKVATYDRGGIEFQTNVFCVFTLGEDPEVLQVAYDGEPCAENVRVVKFKPENQPVVRVGQPTVEGREVESLVDDLDDLDKAEVHRYIQNQMRHELPSDDNHNRTEPRNPAPYRCDSDRIFAAIYSQAQDETTKEQIEWTALPAKVAADRYRDLLGRHAFDELFRHEEAQGIPLHQMKSVFSRTMRNLGVLSFQVVQRKDGKGLSPGMLVPQEDLVFYPVHAFQTPKVLRVRGIKVKAAGFTELNPVHADVRPQQVDTWSATWKKESERWRSEYEANASLVRAQARAKAHQEMVEGLRIIFNSEPGTQEALAMRVYQALEAAAADPMTRKLLPSETISLLNNLESWLAPPSNHPPLPDGDGKEGK